MAWWQLGKLLESAPGLSHPCACGFGIQTLTATAVITAPNFACSDELVMLLTSDNEHGADAGVCHL